MLFLLIFKILSKQITLRSIVQIKMGHVLAKLILKYAIEQYYNLH